jgi:glutaredoxin 3
LAKVEIYTTALCPFCYRAKKLLDKKGVQYIEFDVSTDPEGRAKMRERSGGRHTVPQIFIDGQHVGGCDELYALEQRGALDAMLAA